MHLAVPDTGRPAPQARGRKEARQGHSQDDVPIALHEQLHGHVCREQRRVLHGQARSQSTQVKAALARFKAVVCGHAHPFYLRQGLP